MELFQRILTKDEINHRFILATTAILAKQLIPNKTALAESLNIKPAKFSEILNGRMKAGTDMLATMCDLYNVSPDWLLMSRGDNIFRASSIKPKIWIDDEDLKSKLPDTQEETEEKPLVQDKTFTPLLELIKDKDTTIREQAEEIGRLKEQIRQMTIEKKSMYRMPTLQILQVPGKPISLYNRWQAVTPNVCPPPHYNPVWRGVPPLFRGSFHVKSLINTRF